jgi:hypothetical protein
MARPGMAHAGHQGSVAAPSGYQERIYYAESRWNQALVFLPLQPYPRLGQGSRQIAPFCSKPQKELPCR